MSNIENILKAKHWHLFLAFFAIPFTLKMFSAFFAMFSGFGMSGMASVAGLLHLISYLMFLSVLSWFWTVGSILKESISHNPVFDFKYFKWAITFLAFIAPVSSFITGIFLSTDTFELLYSNPIVSSIANLFGILFIAAYIFSGLWILIYTSKCIATVEKDANSILVEQFIYFILLMFLPIGIWFIQPRINKLVNDKNG